MQPELIIHIGLPKTGSTAIQHHLFPMAPGRRHLPGSEGHRAFLALFERDKAHPDWGSASNGTGVRGWYAEFGARDGLTLVSQEMLPGWRVGRSEGFGVAEEHPRSRTGRPPAAEFLTRVSHELAPSTRVRVVVVVRNQADWLASYFAELSSQGHLWRSSQREFDLRVRRILELRDDQLNWSLLIDQLSCAVGPDNLLVCLFEDGIDRVSEQIKGFVGGDWGQPRSIPPTRVHRQDNGWRLILKHPTMRDRAKRLRVGREAALHALWRIDGFSGRFLRTRGTRSLPARMRRTGRLRLSARDRQRVIDHVSVGNLALEASLRRDLRSLGYLRNI